MEQRKAMLRDIADLVRLDRYPLDRPKSRAYRALAAKCRAELDADGCCSLAGFLTEAALAEMRDESAAAAPAAHICRERSNVYFSDDDRRLPPQTQDRTISTWTAMVTPAISAPMRTGMDSGILGFRQTPAH